MINNLAGKSRLLDTVAVAFSSWLLYLAIAAALLVPGIIFFFSRLHHRQYAILKVWLEYILSFFFAWVVVGLLKLWVAFPRPQELLQHINALLPYGTMDSFPSLHSAIAFALATTTYGWSKKVGDCMFIFAVLVALSRIYVGAHFPLDVFAGALIGILVGYTFRGFFVTYVD